jgi:hypothetical protein
VNTALLVARLALATVFGAAGVAKVFGRDGTRATAAAFGVPARLGGPVALALPAAELLVAAALIPASSAALASRAALALLAIFSASVAITLARGRHPDCYCFGQLTASPIGWRTLARNVALAAVAGFIALGGWGAGQLDGWPDGGTSLGELVTSRVAVMAAVIALALAVIVDTAVVVLLLGGHGAGPHRRDQAADYAAAGATTTDATAGVVPGPAPTPGLPVGTAAPEFEVAGAEGRPMTLAGLRSAGHPVLLVFTDPDCGNCRSLVPDIAAWQAGHTERFTAALISRRPAVASAGVAAQYDLAHVGVQRDREVAVAYAYAGTPSAVVVSADGRIASRVAAGPDGVRALVTALLARTATAGATAGAATAGRAARAGAEA